MGVSDGSDGEKSMKTRFGNGLRGKLPMVFVLCILFFFGYILEEFVWQNASLFGGGEDGICALN